MWENLRAASYKKKYAAERNIPASACSNLSQIEDHIRNARYTTQAASTPPVIDQGLADTLNHCALESRRMNISRPRSEEAQAWFLLLSLDSRYKGEKITEMAAEYNQLLFHDADLMSRYNTLAMSYNELWDHALKNAAANDAFVRSLRQRVSLQSLQKPQLTCSGTSYSAGNWGMSNINCQ